MAVTIENAYVFTKDNFGNISRINLSALIIEQGVPVIKSNRIDIITSNIALIFKLITDVLKDINLENQDLKNGLNLDLVSADKIEAIYNSYVKLKKLPEYKSPDRFKQKIKEAIVAYTYGGTVAGLKAVVSLFVDYPALEIIDNSNLFDKIEITTTANKVLYYGNSVIEFEKDQSLGVFRKGQKISIGSDSRIYEIFAVDDDLLYPKLFVSPAFNRDIEPKEAIYLYTPYIETCALEGDYIFYYKTNESVEVYKNKLARFTVLDIVGNKIKLGTLTGQIVGEIPFDTFITDQVLQVGSTITNVIGLEQVPNSYEEMWLEVNSVDGVNTGDIIYSLELLGYHPINFEERREIIEGVCIVFSEIAEDKSRAGKYSIVKIKNYVELTPYSENVIGFSPAVEITNYFDGGNEIKTEYQLEVSNYIKRCETVPITIQVVPGYPYTEHTIKTYTEANGGITYINKDTGEITLSENTDTGRVWLNYGGALLGNDSNLFSNYYIYYNYNATIPREFSSAEKVSYDVLKNGTVPAHLSVNLVDKIWLVADTYINGVKQSVVYEMSNDIVLRRYVLDDEVFLGFSDIHFVEKTFNDKIWFVGTV